MASPVNPSTPVQAGAPGAPPAPAIQSQQQPPASPSQQQSQQVQPQPQQAQQPQLTLQTAPPQPLQMPTPNMQVPGNLGALGPAGGYMGFAAPPSPTNPMFQQWQQWQQQQQQQQQFYPQMMQGYPQGGQQMGMGWGYPQQPGQQMMGGYPPQQPLQQQPYMAMPFPNQPYPPQPQPYSQQQPPQYPNQPYGQPYPQPNSWQPLTGGYQTPTNIDRTTPLSLGYSTLHVQNPVIYPPDEVSRDLRIILKAFDSTNTDKEALTHVLTKRVNPLEMESIRAAYRTGGYAKPPSSPLLRAQKKPTTSTIQFQFSRAGSSQVGAEPNLIDVVNAKKLNFGGGFKDVVHALICGPLHYDAYLLNRAMEGVGTREWLLDLVLLGRSNADILAIKEAYNQTYCQGSKGKSLEKALESDLSGDVLALFFNVVEGRREWDDVNVAKESGAEWQKLVEKDCLELYSAMVGSADGGVAEIFATRSDIRLSAINKAYTTNAPGGKSLERAIQDKFRGHMEDALLYILRGAAGRAAREARILYKLLSSKRNKEEEIAIRIVKVVWEDFTNRGYLGEVMGEFSKLVEEKKKGGLIEFVKQNTSGDFEKILVGLLKAV